MRESGKRKREREGERRKSVCMCDKGSSHNLQKTRLSKKQLPKRNSSKKIRSHSLWSNCKRKIDALGKKVTMAQKMIQVYCSWGWLVSNVGTYFFPTIEATISELKRELKQQQKASNNWLWHKSEKNRPEWKFVTNSTQWNIFFHWVFFESKSNHCQMVRSPLPMEKL